MKCLLLPLLAALALPTAINANVNPEVHKLCLPAADYLGCVKAITTKSTGIPDPRSNQGVKILTDNSCPDGYGYIGSGFYQEIVCVDEYMEEDSRLPGKVWECNGKNALTARKHYLTKVYWG